MAHSEEDVSGHVKVYISIFVALLVLTGVTVGVSYLHLSSITLRIIVALLVAGTKASLVALFFMHLKTEKLWVYTTLAFTAFFVLLAFALPAWTENDHIIGTQPNKWAAGIAVPHTPGHSPEAAH
jgi:cytochrome c oxidase subunit 4